MMQYKGYTGVVEVDVEAGILFGRVVGLRDVVTFQGETVAEARRAFEESVDDYLAFCAERGELPEKPFSGKFLVRLTPALHRILSIRAEAEGISLNSVVERSLEATAISGAASGLRSGGSASRLPAVMEFLVQKLHEELAVALERFPEPSPPPDPTSPRAAGGEGAKPRGASRRVSGAGAKGGAPPGKIKKGGRGRGK